MEVSLVECNVVPCDTTAALSLRDLDTSPLSCQLKDVNVLDYQ